MKKGKKFQLLSLLLTLIIIAAIIYGIYYFLNKKLNTVVKVEEEYSKTEVAELLAKTINAKIVEASKQNEGTTNDISTNFNENNLISYLDNKSSNENCAGIDCIDPYEKSEKIQNASGDGEVYTIYIIKPEVLSENINNGIKGNFEDGDIFTLEPIINTQEDGTKKSTGSYEIKYYDTDKKSTVVETVDLYLTKQS